MAEPGFQLPDLEGKPLPSRTFTSTYHDTADRRLLAAGITLRRAWRTERGCGSSSCRPPAGGWSSSQAARSSRQSSCRCWRASSVAASSAGRRAADATRRRSRDTGRWSCGRDSRRRLRAREAPHDGSLRRGGDRARFRRCGRARTARARATRSRREEARRPAEDRAGAVGGVARRPARRPMPPTQAHVQAMLEAQYRNMVAHDPGVRLGDDPEDLHQLRVATRRLRAILRAARGVIDPSLGGRAAERRQVAGSPARARARLRRPARQPRRRAGRAWTSRSGRASTCCCASSATRGRATRVSSWPKRCRAIATSRCSTRSSSLSRRRVSPATTRSWRRSQRPSFGSCAVRYARSARTRRTRSSTPCGSVASARDMRQSSRRPRQARRRRRFIRGPRQFQDVIGDHQDAVVAEEELRRVAGLTRSQPAALAAGRLIERQQTRSGGCGVRSRRRGRASMPPGSEPGRDSEVRAAGGVVVRRQDGQDEVLVVHRPRYDDWTLPKGKLKPGESDEEGALREVEEETGLRCRLGRELQTVSYVDRRGRDKTVRYWEMAPLDGTFSPNHEVDEVRWLTLEEAEGDLELHTRPRSVRESRTHGRRGSRMKTVLFVCNHNAGRSQMAEAFFNHYAPEDVRAESAGNDPGVGDLARGRRGDGRARLRSRRTGAEEGDRRDAAARRLGRRRRLRGHVPVRADDARGVGDSRSGGATAGGGARDPRPRRTAGPDVADNASRRTFAATGHITSSGSGNCCRS